MATTIQTPAGSTTPTATSKRSVHDFQFGSRIGEGSYSTVYRAIDYQSKKVYAIKVLSKKHIVKEKKIKYVNIEKTTLNRLGRHPGIVTLYYTFQDENSLYFVIDMAEFGELLTIIRKLGSLSEECSKYYMIQLIDAVDFMHKKGIIHRDLKPENILVNSEMKLMITDFGAAKVLELDERGEIIENKETEESFAKGSFVGTAEYVSPELLKFNKCGFECDIWAIGCILYQFLVGVPPFKGKTEYLTFEKIVNLQYQWPNFYIPPTIKDLVDNLLKSNPFDRLTIPQIQKHKWFGNFNWDDKSKIWITNPPKLEPYQSIIQQHNENNQNLKKIVIQKKVPAATAKKQLLTNTLKQIKNDTGSFMYTPMSGTTGQTSLSSPQKLQQPQPNYKPVNKNNLPKNSPMNSPARMYIAPPQPAFNSSNSPRSRSPVSPQPRPLNNMQQQQQPVQFQRPQPPPPPSKVPKLIETQFIQRQPPVPQQNSRQPIPQQNPVIPAYVQSIKQQLPPQIRTQAPQQSQSPLSPQPRLAPPLVPMAFQVKPQTMNGGPAGQQAQIQRPLVQPPRIQPSSTKSSPTASNKFSSPAKPPTVRSRNGSGSVTSSPRSPKPMENDSSRMPKEISQKLESDETVSKLDYINESELVYSSLHTFDPSSSLARLEKNAGLDDITIHEIITKNESQLQEDTKRIIMLITDRGNLYLFRSPTLKQFEFYLKIDLTDKMFAMYDYEFSEFNQSGYLILEITKIDRLIFLAPLSKDVQKDLEEITNIQIGIGSSWIEALLKTKELLKSKPTSPPVQSPAATQPPQLLQSPVTKPSSTSNMGKGSSTTPTTSVSTTMRKTKSSPIVATAPTSISTKVSKSASNGTSPTTTNGASPTTKGNKALPYGNKALPKTKPPQAKPPKRPTSKTPPPAVVTTQQKIQQQNRNFAGGAAAAAFNASR